MKMRVSQCFVCDRFYDTEEKYLQVEVCTSEEMDKPGRASKHLMVLDALPDTHVAAPGFRLSGWMRTSWVCLPCVGTLPPAWQALFQRPSLEEFEVLGRLDDGTGDARVDKVKRVRKPNVGVPDPNRSDSGGT